MDIAKARLLRVMRTIWPGTVIFLLLAALFTSHVTKLAGSRETETVERLTQDIMSMDVSVIQDSLGQTYAIDGPKTQQLLLDLWNERRDKHPEFPWDIIRTPQVRVWLAMSLASIAREGKEGVNNTSLREYVWTTVDSRSDAVVREAFFLIGGLGELEDVGRIEKYLAAKKPTTQGGFYGAIWALAQMCNQEASKLLDKLETQLKDQKRKQIFYNLRGEWEKQKTQGNHCK